MRNIIINEDKILFTVLLISIILYYSQGVLIPFGGIGQVFLLLIYAISIFYLIKLLLRKKRFSEFMIVWVLFMSMNVVAFLLYNDYSEFAILKGVLLNFLPFFAFYYFSEKKILTSKVLVIVFSILLSIFIIKFNQSIMELRFERNKDEVVENTIYLFIGLLPFAFMFKKKIFSLISLLVIWYFMVQSAKRGAIVCGAIALVLFAIQTIYTSKDKIDIKQYIIVILLFSAITYFGYRFYQDNPFLIERMGKILDGDSAGRDRLIKNIFNTWYDSDNVFNYLFGFGYNSSQLISGMDSHNDWIDILASFGLVGLVIYFSIYRLLFLQILRKGWPLDKKIILLLVLCIALVTSLTSRWYWGAFGFMQILIIPYLLSDKQNDF